MKALITFASLLLFHGTLLANQPASDWVQLELKNGTKLHGYVLRVTDKDVHLVSSSINRLITRDQLSEKCQQSIAERFVVTVLPEPAPATTATTSTISSESPSIHERLYEPVSDLYSPRPYRTRAYRSGLYYHNYYLPSRGGYYYPGYSCYSRSYYTSPTLNIKIDL